MVEQWNSIAECGGTVWNGMVIQWSSVVEQWHSIVEHCNPVWWNSGTLWWNSVERHCVTMEQYGGTV